MPLKGEEKKAYNKQYHTNAKIERQYEKQKAEVTRILFEVDPSGERYKSEALSQAQLMELFTQFAENTLFFDPPVTLSFETWLEFRDRARKDLFWLGGVLKWHWYEHVHRKTCDFFVKKNFDGVYHEGYTLEQVHAAINKQHKVKHRLLLDPRHHYKTTIDSVDALQWLLNAPDARVFILTAEEDNAEEFMLQIKGYMNQPKGHPLTDFQRLFPEYVVRGKDGSSKEDLVSPARRIAQKDPTLWAESIMSTLSSQHCDIMKADDVISNRNSDNEEARAKLKRKFDQAIHLLSPKGFFDILGTRYATGDWYDERMKASEEYKEKFPGKEDLIVQVRAGLTIRAGRTPDGIAWEDLPLKQLELEMVDLLFPEFKGTAEETFEFFMSEILNNEMDFRCQILNQPAYDANIRTVVHFPEDQLVRSTEITFTPPNKDPKDILIIWDTATTGNKQSDFCVGVVGQIWQRSEIEYLLLIWEILADKMTNSDLARNMVALSKKWTPLETKFEMPRMLEKHDFMTLLNMEKTRQEFYDPIYSFVPDSVANAKVNRIKSLQPLFVNGLIKFMPGCKTEMAFEQFRKFTAGKKKTHDDIPDAIGMIAKRMPYIGIHPNPEIKILEAQNKARAEKENQLRLLQRVFGEYASPIVPSKLNQEPAEDEDGDNPIYKALRLLKRPQ